MSRGRKMVEERWGYPFWEVVRDFAEQGLDRAKVSRALGIDYKHFQRLLINYPKKDPFPSSNKQIAYLHDTGETFRKALDRLQASGLRVRAAAWELGFADASALRRHLENRGWHGYFPKKDSIAEYCEQHGLTRDQAFFRLRAEGYSKTRAAKVLGLSHNSQLTLILKREGYPTDFFSMAG